MATEQLDAMGFATDLASAKGGSKEAEVCLQERMDRCLFLLGVEAPVAEVSDPAQIARDMARYNKF